MDNEKLKLIVRNLESLVNCLKVEIYSDASTEVPLHLSSRTYNYEEIAQHITDYDEVFYEEDDDYSR